MKLKVLPKCKKCNDILFQDRECKCGNLACIFMGGNLMTLYCDNEDYEFILGYLDDTNKLVKIIEYPVKELARYIFDDIEKFNVFKEEE